MGVELDKVTVAVIVLPTTALPLVFTVILALAAFTSPGRSKLVSKPTNKIFILFIYPPIVLI